MVTLYIHQRNNNVTHSQPSRHTENFHLRHFSGFYNFVYYAGVIHLLLSSNNNKNKKHLNSEEFSVI